VSFREFRWVLGLVLFDRIHWHRGYFCDSCRKRVFAKNQALTLVFGWWGVLALFIRNPYSILKNFKALVAPPLSPRDKGALNLSDLVQSEPPGATP
jgi:hypothetical protein